MRIIKRRIWADSRRYSASSSSRRIENRANLGKRLAGPGKCIVGAGQFSAVAAGQAVSSFCRTVHLQPIWVSTSDLLGDLPVVLLELLAVRWISRLLFDGYVRLLLYGVLQTDQSSLNGCQARCLRWSAGTLPCVWVGAIMMGISCGCQPITMQRQGAV